MTENFRQLKENITQLKETFFLKRKDLTGDYTPEEKLKVAAYVTLVHGEFENFFETVCWKKAQSSVSQFSTSGSLSNTILGLLAFSDLCVSDYRELPKEDIKNGVTKKKLDKSIKKWDSSLLLEDRIKASLNTYNFLIEENHGIKRANLLDMLLPIGFPTDNSIFNYAYFENFDNFGEIRGNIVHHSGKQFVTQEKDPYEYEDLIQKLIEDAERIDNIIEAL